MSDKEQWTITFDIEGSVPKKGDIITLRVHGIPFEQVRVVAVDGHTAEVEAINEPLRTAHLN